MGSQTVPRFCIWFRETFSTWISLTGSNKCGKSWNSISARLPCYLLKGLLKRDFLDIYLTTFFGIRYFENTSAMRIIFFLKILRIETKFPKCKKELQIIFPLLDSCTWKCCYNLCLMRREYFLSAPNVLKNSPKILHISLRNFLNLNCIHRDH